MQMDPMPNHACIGKTLYEKAVVDEDTLKKLSVSKPISHPAFRHLRSSIRERYETIILGDQFLAESLNVEQALWKVHHDVIINFREEICKLQPQRWSRGKAAYKKIMRNFKYFLTDASQFYANLITKLRVKHGLPQDVLLSHCIGVQKGSENDELQRCHTSCYRCFLALGDLARYKELYLEEGVRDFSNAESYYRQALLIFPNNGNPHNQFAVLASKVGDQRLAVYHYVRSMSTSVPFVKASGNLRRLLNAIDVSDCQVVMEESESSFFGEDFYNWKDSLKSNIAQASAPTAIQTNTAMYRQFSSTFLALTDILLNRRRPDQLKNLLSATLSYLKQLLDKDATIGRKERSEIPVNGISEALLGVQMIATLIFLVHKISDEGSSTSDNFLTYALAVAARLVSLLVCIALQHFDKLLLPGISVFFAWLTIRKDIITYMIKEKELKEAVPILLQQAEALLLMFLSNDSSCSNKVDSELLRRSLSSGDFENGLTSESEVQQALWEDHQLYDFGPLKVPHSSMDFEQKVEMDDCFQLRMKRFEASLNGINDAIKELLNSSNDSAMHVIRNLSPSLVSGSPEHANVEQQMSCDKNICQARAHGESDSNSDLRAHVANVSSTMVNNNNVVTDIRHMERTTNKSQDNVPKNGHEDDDVAAPDYSDKVIQQESDQASFPYTQGCQEVACKLYDLDPLKVPHSSVDRVQKVGINDCSQLGMERYEASLKGFQLGMEMFEASLKDSSDAMKELLRSSDDIAMNVNVSPSLVSDFSMPSSDKNICQARAHDESDLRAHVADVPSTMISNNNVVSNISHKEKITNQSQENVPKNDHKDDDIATRGTAPDYCDKVTEQESDQVPLPCTQECQQVVYGEQSVAAVNQNPVASQGGTRDQSVIEKSDGSRDDDQHLKYRKTVENYINRRINKKARTTFQQQQQMASKDSIWRAAVAGTRKYPRAPSIEDEIKHYEDFSLQGLESAGTNDQITVQIDEENQSVEDLTWLDKYTHVPPVAFKPIRLYRRRNGCSDERQKEGVRPGELSKGHLAVLSKFQIRNPFAA